MMGAYKDKLNYEERWQVIHHIRALQANAAGLTYNENENTLNEYAVPAASVKSEKDVMAEAKTDDEHGASNH